MANKPGIEIYRKMLHAPVYGLWTGAMDISNFIESFSDAVFTGLRAAWLAGAEQAGVMPDEMTNREIIQMQTDIFVQLTYVAGFGNFIMQHSCANKGKLAACITRMELWVSRFNEFYTRGYAMAKLDQKLKWALGATDRHLGVVSN